MTTTAWLLEWPATPNSPTRYWNPDTGWMMDANLACWFARQADAEAYKRTSKMHGEIVSTQHVFGLSPNGASQQDAAGWHETWIGDEEDGPAVAILIDLPDGSQIWTGEVSQSCFDELSTDHQDALGSAGGDLVMLARKGRPLRILARAADMDSAVEIARALALSLPPQSREDGR